MGERSLLTSLLLDHISTVTGIFFWLNLALTVVLGYLVIKFLITGIRYFTGRNKSSTQTQRIRKTLGQTLKDCRTACNMTQEFVAQQMGVSRQAVSKWENGTSEPSTSNLIALAKLYGVDAGELLRNIET